MNFTRNRAFLAGVVLSLVVACAPVYRNHGFTPPEVDLAQVQIGQTTRADVDTLVGSPSAPGLLEGGDYYYVASRWRHYGPYKPEEVNREVVAIRFDGNDRVANVERFGLRDGRIVVLSRRVTEGSITEVSLIRQALGNLGNFSAADYID